MLNLEKIAKFYTPLLFGESLNIDLQEHLCNKLDNYDSIKSDNISILKISIPYATQKVNLEIVHDSTFSFYDIIFDDKYQDYAFNFDSLVSQGLIGNKNSCVVDLIHQIMKDFCQYQLRQIEDEDIRNGLNTVICDKLHFQNHFCYPIEIISEKTAEGFTKEIHILIGLHIDTKDIPEIVKSESFGKHEACVLFHFSEAKAKFISKIFLSPLLQATFDLYNVKIKCPDFDYGNSKDSFSIYIEYVGDMLQKEIHTIAKSRDKRQEFVQIMLTKYEGAVCEYDSEKFLWIILLLEWRDFYFNAKIILSEEFPHPDDPPNLLFISIYHESQQSCKTSGSLPYRPFVKSYCNMPYSPRWSISELTKRVQEFILANIKDFQQGSVCYGNAT